MSELGSHHVARRDAWIEQGWVHVDGAPAVLGQKVLPHQFHRRAAAQEQASRVTVLINKPMVMSVVRRKTVTNQPSCWCVRRIAGVTTARRCASSANS